MSSYERNPDDEDTGPVNVNRFRPPADTTDARYNPPMSVNPRPVHKNRSPVVPIAVAAVAVLGLGALAWAFWPKSDGGDGAAADNSTTSSADVAREAQTRLLGALPKGYAEGACESVVPAKGALAQVSCTSNDDVGGPLTAVYTVVENEDAMTAFFDQLTGTTSVVDCPGNIQSPGPWRRNASPEQVAGSLVCGFTQSKPTVAWTTQAELMISEVQSGPQGPNMVQLYTWWSSHS